MVTYTRRKKTFSVTKQPNEAAEPVSKFLIQCFDRFYSLSSKCAPLLSHFSQKIQNLKRVFMTNIKFFPQNETFGPPRSTNQNVWHQRSKRCSIFTNNYFLRRTVELAHVFVTLRTRLRLHKMRSSLSKFLIRCFDQF